MSEKTLKIPIVLFSASAPEGKSVFSLGSDFFTVYGQHIEDFNAEHSTIKSNMWLHHRKGYKNRNWPLNSGSDNKYTRPELFWIKVDPILEEVSIINARNQTGTYDKNVQISTIEFIPQTFYDLGAESYKTSNFQTASASQSVNYGRYKQRQLWNQQLTSSAYRSYDNQEHSFSVNYPLEASPSSSWWVSQSVRDMSNFQDNLSLTMSMESGETTLTRNPSYDLQQDTIPWISRKHYSRKNLEWRNENKYRITDTNVILSNESSQTLETQESPVIEKYFDIQHTFEYNGQVYKISYPYARKYNIFGDVFVSKIDYDVGKSSIKFFDNHNRRTLIKRTPFNFIKDSGIKTLELIYKENIWPKQTRQKLPESYARDGYSFPWSTSSVDRISLGSDSSSFSTTYISDIKMSLWPLDVSYTNDNNTSGEMLVGSSTASYQDFLLAPNQLTFIAPSYGRITAPHPTTSQGTCIPYNEVFQYSSDEDRYLGPVFVENNKKDLYISRMYKNYSLIPEYTVSDKIYSILTGLSINSEIINDLIADGTYISDASEEEKILYRENYVNSDYLTSLGDFKSIGAKKALKLKFDSVINFTPYVGFYPAQRIQQLANLFVNYYNDLISLEGSQQTQKTVISPIFNLLMNSIRASIAVDYPYMSLETLNSLSTLQTTTNTPGYVFSPFGTLVSGQTVLPLTNKNTYTASMYAYYGDRLPFEGLWNQHKYLGGKKIIDWDIEIGNFDSTGSFSGSSPIFDLAMENFVVESSNFFLNNSTVSFLKSKPENLWKFSFPNLETASSNNRTIPEYSMDVVVSNRNFCNHDALSFYGPPPYIYHAPFYMGSDWESLYSGSKEQDRTGSYILFSENHVDNEAYATITFDVNRVYEIDPARYTDILSSNTISLEDIKNYSTITYVNKGISSSVNPYNSGGVPDTFMKIDAGVDLFGKTIRKEWMINTKHEWPALDFREVAASSYLNQESAGPNPVGRTIRGLWHQLSTGQEVNADSGLFLSVRDSKYVRGSQTSSLADACGFEVTEKRIGQLASERELSEAVIVIPYYTDDCEKERYFDLDIEEFEECYSRVHNRNVVNTSICDAIDKSQRFILPPIYDYFSQRRNSKEKLTKEQYTSFSPFAMYIFEIKDTIEQQDLLYIWQNIAPRNTLALKEKSHEINHPIQKYEMISTDIPDNVRFKIFKVKSKAMNSYEQFKDKLYGTHNYNERISYNWPHDYYSLVELGKLEATIVFGED